MTKPGPGKFEFNDSQEASEILYQHSLDGSHDSFGDSSVLGWFCLILSDALSEQEKSVCSNAAYICEETPQGFFIVTPFESRTEALKKFEELSNEWNITETV